MILCFASFLLSGELKLVYNLVREKGWVDIGCPPDELGSVLPKKVSNPVPKDVERWVAWSFTKLDLVTLYCLSAKWLSDKLKSPRK